VLGEEEEKKEGRKKREKKGKHGQGGGADRCAPGLLGYAQVKSVFGFHPKPLISISRAVGGGGKGGREGRKKKWGSGLSESRKAVITGRPDCSWRRFSV